MMVIILARPVGFPSAHGALGGEEVLLYTVFPMNK